MALLFDLGATEAQIKAFMLVFFGKWEKRGDAVYLVRTASIPPGSVGVSRGVSGGLPASAFPLRVDFAAPDGAPGFSVGLGSVMGPN
jgi:hypothetical protein